MSESDDFRQSEADPGNIALLKPLTAVGYALAMIAFASALFVAQLLGGTDPISYVLDHGVYAPIILVGYACLAWLGLIGLVILTSIIFRGRRAIFLHERRLVYLSSAIWSLNVEYIEAIDLGEFYVLGTPKQSVKIRLRSGATRWLPLMLIETSPAKVVSKLRGLIGRG